MITLYLIKNLKEHFRDKGLSAERKGGCNHVNLLSFDHLESGEDKVRYTWGQVSSSYGKLDIALVAEN